MIGYSNVEKPSFYWRFKPKAGGQQPWVEWAAVNYKFLQFPAENNGAPDAPGGNRAALRTIHSMNRDRLRRSPNQPPVATRCHPLPPFDPHLHCSCGLRTGCQRDRRSGSPSLVATRDAPTRDAPAGDAREHRDGDGS